MQKKLIAFAGLLVAFAFIGSARTANAQTTAELEAQVQALLAQIAQLQGGASAAGCYSFTRDLTVGSSGADVTALQNYLAVGGYFNVAATGYFGSITQAALAAWQAANGVAPAAGYFGPISRAKYNSMCGSAGDDDDDDGDDDDDFDSGDGEEADLSDFDTKSGDDTTLQEAQEEGEVLEFEFDVDGSDVEVQRVEVNFNSSVTAGTGEEDPWKSFEAAQLWFDGEMVAEVDDLDDEDTWDEEVSNDEWSFRFNGVDVVVNDGDTAEFIVSFNTASSIDGASTAGANTWLVSIDANGVRALDEAGIDQYTGESGDDVTVEIEEAGADTELSVTQSDDDPDPTVFEVEDGETSDWYTVGILTASAEGGDVQLNDVRLDIAAANGSDTYDGLVNDVQLVIGGDEFGDFTVNSGTTATGTLIFDLDDDDVIVEDGEDVEIEVQVEFKGLTGNFDEGDNIVLNASSTGVDSWDAEDVSSGEDLADGQVDGSYEGEEHTVRTSGIIVTMVDSSEVSPVGGDEAQANFEIEFTVEAFGADFFVENSAIVDTTADGSDGVEYSIEDSTNTATATASVSDTLQASGSSAGDNSYGYKVSEGSTRTFTLLITFDATGTGTAGYYHAQIYGISFDADGAAGSESFISTGLDDFETDDVYVSNADAAN
jgi:hypothetical protein